MARSRVHLISWMAAARFAAHLKDRTIGYSAASLRTNAGRVARRIHRRIRQGFGNT
jgi:hypothetical protein